MIFYFNFCIIKIVTRGYNILGNIDIETKKYMSKNEIFADAFNFFIHNGEKIIKPDELQEMDTTEIVIPYGNEAKEPKQKSRDILKIWASKRGEKAIYVILGIENQANIHYAMVVKNMLYDAMNYANQIEEAKKSYKKNTTKLTPEEFLSGFRKEDKLLPVITLTVYFGAEEWDGPMSLHEMLKIDDKELLKYIPNYQLNLIAPKNIQDVDFDKFNTDLGRLLEYIKHQNDENLNWLLEKKYREIDRETADLINTVTGSKLKFEEEEEKIDMCRAFENSMKMAEARGEARGEAKGENKVWTLINFLLRDNRQDELQKIKDDENKRQELYKFYGITTN